MTLNISKKNNFNCINIGTLPSPDVVLNPSPTLLQPHRALSKWIRAVCLLYATAYGPVASMAEWATKSLASGGLGGLVFRPSVFVGRFRAGYLCRGLMSARARV
jgi:hypothetical protein